jgi:hypothetical protein
MRSGAQDIENTDKNVDGKGLILLVFAINNLT